MKMVKIVPHLEITEKLLSHCNDLNNSYQKLTHCIHLFQINQSCIY